MPLGQAGTGAAYILPQGNAAQGFVQNLRYYDQQRMMQDRLRNQEAQQLAKSYRDNMLTASSGRLWANEIGAMEQRHIQQGMDYRGQGWDIYNPDPNNTQQMSAHQQYMQDRARIEGMRGYRSEVESQYNKIQESLRKANLGEYNPADIQRLHDFVTGDLTELYEQSAGLPEVRKRFNPRQYLPSTAAITDETSTEGNVRRRTVGINEPATQASVIAGVANAPGGREYLQELTGGINPQELIKLPDSREGIRETVLRDYQGDPQLQEVLASAPTPVLPDTPAFDRWVTEQSEQLYAAKQRFQPEFDSWMSQVVGGTRTGVTETSDYSAETQARAARNEARAERRERRLEEQAASSGTDVSYIGADSVPAGRESSGNAGTVPIRGAINLANATVGFTGGGAYNMGSRSKERGATSIEGRIINIGEYPFDSNGDVLDESQMSSTDSVEWRKMALIRQTENGITKNLLVPASKIPSTLSGNKQKMVEAFLREPASDTSEATQENDADPLGLGI